MIHVKFNPSVAVSYFKNSCCLVDFMDLYPYDCFNKLYYSNDPYSLARVSLIIVIGLIRIWEQYFEWKTTVFGFMLLKAIKAITFLCL